MTLLIELGVLTAMTVVASWSLRGKTITAPVVVIVFAFAGAVGLAGFWFNQRQTEARAHELCIARSDARGDVRAAFTQLYDTLEVAFPTDETRELITGLRAGLNELLPPLDRAAC